MRTVYGVAAAVIVLDQLTKFLAVRYLAPIQSIAVIPDFFYLSYTQNTGIAFGFFQNSQVLLTWIISFSILALVIGARYFSNRDLLHRGSFGFILGGAVGNWIDRIRVQSVIDFLDFRVWPVFNLADSFICIGVVLFVWVAFKSEKTCTR